MVRVGEKSDDEADEQLLSLLLLLRLALRLEGRCGDGGMAHNVDLAAHDKVSQKPATSFQAGG